MKITVSNITQEYPKLNIKLPEILAQEKFEKLKSTFLPLYDKSEVVKKTVDTFILKLNEAVAKSNNIDHQTTKTSQKKAKSVKESTKSEKKLTNKAKKPVTKKAATAKKDEKCNSVESIKTEHFTEDVRLLRRFAGCIGKERQRRTILTIYRDFERRITERKVSRNSKHADLVWQCSKKLAALLDAMAKQKLTHVTIEVDDSFQDKINQATKEVAIRTSVNLLKRFVGIEGETKPDRAKVERIMNAFDNATKQKKVSKEDFYAHELKQAYKAMKNFMDNKVDYIAIEPTTLSGLDKYFGLGKSKTTAKTIQTKKPDSGKVTKKKTVKAAKVQKPNKQLNGIEPEPTPAPAPQSEPVVVNRFQVDLTEHQEPTIFEPEEVNQDNAQEDRSLNGLFTPMADVGKDNHFEKINLPGDLGRFLGYVERYEYSIVLRGEKGAGKTRLTYQMMNTFAKAGFTVGSFTLEIGKDSNLVTDMRNEYLCPTIVDKVQIAESCPGGIDDVKAAAKVFDVVFIDSWGKIPNVDQDDFDRLRKEHPDTMFVVIFQSTTNGTVRGGSKAEYDGGMVIQVQKGGRAICEKNRYNGEDLTYLVFQRKLEEPKPAE